MFVSFQMLIDYWMKELLLYKYMYTLHCTIKIKKKLDVRQAPKYIKGTWDQLNKKKFNFLNK